MHYCKRFSKAFVTKGNDIYTYFSITFMTKYESLCIFDNLACSKLFFSGSKRKSQSSKLQVHLDSKLLLAWFRSPSDRAIPALIKAVKMVCFSNFSWTIHLHLLFRWLFPTTYDTQSLSRMYRSIARRSVNYCFSGILKCELFSRDSYRTSV